MPRKHLVTLALINRDKRLAARVRIYFSLKRGTLAPLFRKSKLGQADLVLCLLRFGDKQSLDFVERLVGRPIKYGPSFRLTYPKNGTPTSRVDTSPRVTFVVPNNPRLGSTKAHDRFQEIKVGRTVKQLRARGVTRRDINKAVRRGWIQLKEVTQHASH